MEMGDRIKERRTALGLTQEELGDKLGVQKSAIAKYENGRVENIKRSVIQKMAEVLGCTPSYILGFDDEDFSADDKLLEVTRNMSDEQIAKIIEYAQFIKSQK